VESDRLRAMLSLPPEMWHTEWPLVALDRPLVYRRTVVLVKNGLADYIVLRDQFRAPMEIGAAFCLHVRDDRSVALDAMGGGGETDGTATFKDPSQDFAKLGVQPGWVLHVSPKPHVKTDKSLKDAEPYEVRAVNGSALTLDRPVAAGTNRGYLAFKPTFQREGQSVSFKDVTLFCARPADTRFRFFPWFHRNGCPEATQGARLETKGREGEFITVLYPGQARELKAIDGGVRVNGDEIVFGGGLDETAGTTYVTVRRGGQGVLALTGKDIDLNRSQGEIGLFVPDAGYPFGEFPDWLVRQRVKRPAWYEEWKP
jgi:hypothetical protein